MLAWVVIAPTSPRETSRSAPGSAHPAINPLESHPCAISQGNSHRITFFAHPHPLTQIESYSYEKQGGPLPRAVGDGSHVSARRAGIPATPFPSCVYFITRGHPGVGAYPWHPYPLTQTRLRQFRLCPLYFITSSPHCFVSSGCLLFS